MLQMFIVLSLAYQVSFFQQSAITT